MSTFLELCQLTARWSGTIDGVAPTAVSAQVGRLATLVTQVAEAWNQIQLENNGSWRWLRSGFTGALSQSTAKYAPGSYSLMPRFSSWIVEPKSLTIYETALGVSDEGPLTFIDWTVWRQRYDRGTQEEKRPREVAVNPADELCFGNIPDTAYVVKGEYMKGPQVLTADGDIPECRVAYHPIVAWKALILLHEFDEAPVIPLESCQRNYREYLALLNRDQGAVSGTNLRIAAGPLA